MKVREKEVRPGKMQIKEKWCFTTLVTASQAALLTYHRWLSTSRQQYKELFDLQEGCKSKRSDFYSTSYCLTSCFIDIPQVTQHFCAAVQGTSLKGLRKDPHLQGGKGKGGIHFYPSVLHFSLDKIHPMSHSTLFIWLTTPEAMFHKLQFGILCKSGIGIMILQGTGASKRKKNEGGEGICKNIWAFCQIEIGCSEGI